MEMDLIKINIEKVNYNKATIPLDLFFNNVVANFEVKVKEVEEKYPNSFTLKEKDNILYVKATDFGMKILRKLASGTINL